MLGNKRARSLNFIYMSAMCPLSGESPTFISRVFSHASRGVIPTTWWHCLHPALPKNGRAP
jgi:hypothetical protein